MKGHREDTLQITGREKGHGFDKTFLMADEYNIGTYISIRKDFAQDFKAWYF